MDSDSSDEVDCVLMCAENTSILPPDHEMPIYQNSIPTLKRTLLKSYTDLPQNHAR